MISVAPHSALLAIENQFAQQDKRKRYEHEQLARDSVQKNDNRFRNLVRQATVGMIVLRGQDMIVDVVNEMYGRLINRTPEQLLNEPLFSIIPDAEEVFRPILEEVRTSAKPLNL